MHTEAGPDSEKLKTQDPVPRSDPQQCGGTDL